MTKFKSIINKENQFFLKKVIMYYRKQWYPDRDTLNFVVLKIMQNQQTKIKNTVSTVEY